MRTVAKAVLVVLTVGCALSMGGAMLVAAPILVPLHWLAGRDSGGWGAGAWAVLASVSVFQWAWMVAYSTTEAAGGSALVGFAGFAVTGALFLRGAADRHERRLTA